jgi:hypothetical protein
MSNSLADRLKRLAAEQNREHQAGQDVKAFQERVNTYISDHARPEYEALLNEIRILVDQVNPDMGDMPPFQYQGGMTTVQQGNCVAALYFDKPIINMAKNQLLVAFGPHPNNMYFDAPPSPVRYHMVAAASDSLDSIVWVGDLGEMTTKQLSEFVLEQLTDYYLKHKPGH